MRRSSLTRTAPRLLLAALLGVGAAVLVACGGSGKGLIPLADAGPLKHDFEAVAQAAQTGDGDCTATEAAIRKTESDLQALPASVDTGLRDRLEEGVSHLSERARQMCSQPLSPATTTTETTTTKTAPAKTTTTKTSPTATSTSETPPTATTEGQATAPTGTATAPTATQPLGTGGGAQAPGEGQNNEEPAGKGPAGTGSPSPAEGGPGGGTGVGQ
jgi:hypothetical protein